MIFSLEINSFPGWLSSLGLFFLNFVMLICRLNLRIISQYFSFINTLYSMFLVATTHKTPTPLCSSEPGVLGPIF